MTPPGGLPWADLPDAARTAVADLLGGPVAAVDTGIGARAGTSAILTVAGRPPVFVKGQPADAPPYGGQDPDGWWGPSWGPVDELDQEQAINRWLPRSAPRVLWRVRAAGWDLLGFEAAQGRHASYAPDSTDLPLAVAALGELYGCVAPRVRLPSAWDCWGYWCDPSDESRLAGRQLMHGDPAAFNVLISDGKARLVDWSWPSLGPTWADGVLWGMRLVSGGGHSPAEAAAWVLKVPGFEAADRRGVFALAQAEARRWAEEAEQGTWDAESIAAAAQEWADYWK
ncbi:aminoglycoside phosphotransferase [Streptomycetaceae bacterium NBC_01309]